MDGLADLLAEQSITEVLDRYCRGLDRIDGALAKSVSHPDGPPFLSDAS